MKQLLITIAAVVLVGCVPKQLQKTKAIPIQQAAPPTAKAPDISIHKFAFDGNIAVVKQLLTDGVNVNAKEEDGGTALHWASQEGHKEIVELLISSGADVNVSGPFGGGTALHFSVNEGHKEIAELLIAKGANVNAKLVSGPKQGLTPLDAANETNQTEIADLLRKHGGKRGRELKAEGK